MGVAMMDTRRCCWEPLNIWRKREILAALVHFIFQPAEEDGGGGGVMVEEGLFEKFPCDQIYGMHNWPLLPVGKISVRAGPIMGSSDEFDIKITGKGGHAAIPNQTIDPIFVASQVIVALQGAVSRVSDPVKPSVLSVTKVNAGSAYNVIPETATLAGTVRTLDEDTRSTMNKMLHNVTRSVVEGFGATCTIDLKEGYPVTSNAKEPTKFASEVATSVFGLKMFLQTLNQRWVQKILVIC